MTTFSFYKCEGHSSYRLIVSAVETDNIGQSSKEKQVKKHYPSLGPSVRNPEAFYNFFGAYTERIAYEARRCWQEMSTRQRARFFPVRSSKIIRGKLRLAQKTIKAQSSQDFVPKED